MRPSPEELADPARYSLILELKHTDLAPVVRDLIRPPSLVRTSFLMATVIVTAAIGLGWIRSGTSMIETFPDLCLGMCLGYIVLVPIHETVHALAYRYFGAVNPRIVYDWRRLTAYCVADRFVVGAGEFLVVALAPFVVLNAVLIALIALVGGFRPILWGMLFLHVGACVGDFAFANFTWLHRRQGLFTFDDVAAGTTYFYQGPKGLEGESLQG